ncbi:MAG: fructosamine kinase family protein [Pseudomonadota bacterium]
MLNGDIHDRLKSELGPAPARATAIGRSWGLDVLKVELESGGKVLVKTGAPDLAGHLETEAFMLRALGAAGGFPVPKVLLSEPDLLVMDWIENEGAPRTARQERHAGELLAALHSLPVDRFGYHRDTVIGGLPQPNPPVDSWVSFFRSHRLMFIATTCAQRGVVHPGELRRITTLAGRLGTYLNEPKHPSLLHGDLWQGNVLARGDHIAAFIDPAVYHGHPEIELAFTTLFGTFGDAFFEAYGANAALQPDFFEIRRDIYNIYPNLVHAALFGRSYVAPVLRVLDRLGC